MNSSQNDVHHVKTNKKRSELRSKRALQQTKSSTKSQSSVETQTESENHVLRKCIFCRQLFDDLESLYAHLILEKHTTESRLPECYRCKNELSSHQGRLAMGSKHICLRYRSMQLRNVMHRINLDPALYTCLLCCNDDRLRVHSRRFESPLHLAVHILARHWKGGSTSRASDECGLCRNFKPANDNYSATDLEAHIDETHYREYELRLTICQLQAHRQSSILHCYDCPICELEDAESNPNTQPNRFKSAYGLQAHILSIHAGRNSGSGNGILELMCHLCSQDVEKSNYLSIKIGRDNEIGKWMPCSFQHELEFARLKNKLEKSGDLPLSMGYCFATTCPICWKRFDVANVHKSLRGTSVKDGKVVRPMTAQARLQMHIMIEHGVLRMGFMRSLMQDEHLICANKVVNSLLFCEYCDQIIGGGAEDETASSRISIKDKKGDKIKEGRPDFTKMLNEAYNFRLRHLNKHAREAVYNL